MKCRLCQKREGKHLRFIKWAKTELLICEKCRREECPTPAEEQTDYLAEEQADYEEAERYAEFQAELGAGCLA